MTHTRDHRPELQARYGKDVGAVVAEGNDLARAVAEAIAQGFYTGTIYNQYNNASADLADWIQDNGARLQALEMEDGYDDND